MIHTAVVDATIKGQEVTAALCLGVLAVLVLLAVYLYILRWVLTDEKGDIL